MAMHKDVDLFYVPGVSHITLAPACMIVVVFYLVDTSDATEDDKSLFSTSPTMSGALKVDVITQD